MPKYFSLFLVSCLPVPLAGFLFLVSPVNAQIPTSPFSIKLGSFTPAPTIPRPTSLPISPSPADPGTDPGNNGNANLIYDLVNQIKKTCGGGIYYNHKFLPNNMGCISKLQFPSFIDQAVKEELELSAIGTNWLQCLGFVRAAAALVTESQWKHVWGHAISYSTYNVPAGFKFITKTGKVPIRALDIPIWNNTAVGHIAIVTKVFDSNNFEVAEANLGCSGCVRIYPKTIDHPNLIGWLRKK